MRASTRAWSWPLVSVFGALVICVVALSVSTWTVRGFTEKVEEDRAIALARTLAFVAAHGPPDTVQAFIEGLPEATESRVIEAYVVGAGDMNRFDLSLGNRFIANLFVELRGVNPMLHGDPRQAEIYDRAVNALASSEGYEERLAVAPLTGLERAALFLPVVEEISHDGSPCRNANVPVVSSDGTALGVAGVTVKNVDQEPELPIGIIAIFFLVVCVVRAFPVGRGRVGSIATVLVATVFAGCILSPFEDGERTELLSVYADEAQSWIGLANSTIDGDQDIVAYAMRDYRDSPAPELGGLPLSENHAPGSGRAPVVFGLLLALLLTLGLQKPMVRAVEHAAKDPWAYLYVIPAMAGMALLVFVPFIFGFVLAFFERDSGRFVTVGFEHFVTIVTGKHTTEVGFYWTLGVTFLWTGCNVVLHVAIGLALALALNDTLLRFRRIYRVLLILPWAIPNYITALIWKGMFDTNDGAVNRALMVIGVDRVDWLGDSFITAFTANLVTNVWLGFPFMMVVSLGALQSIPRELYEAAEVDGATRWQQFRQITMPLLKPALFPAIILGTIWTFNMFNIIYLVSGGGPNHSTEILITEAYKVFALGRWGYAAAYSVVIFLILLIFSWSLNRMSRATEGAFE